MITRAQMLCAKGECRGLSNFRLLAHKPKKHSSGNCCYCLFFSTRNMPFPPKMVAWRFFYSDKKTLLEREMSNLMLLNHTHLKEDKDSTHARLGHKSHECSINTKWGGEPLADPIMTDTV